MSDHPDTMFWDPNHHSIFSQSGVTNIQLMEPEKWLMCVAHKLKESELVDFEQNLQHFNVDFEQNLQHFN